MFEDNDIQKQVQVSEVTPNSFFFLDNGKSYKINLEVDFMSKSVRDKLSKNGSTIKIKNT